METINTKLLIIGAGPGGYVCAIRAGQLGVDTVIVESERLGGTCLNVGCIPSKALIHAADEFHHVKSFCDARDAESTMGIRASAATIDLQKTIDWKNSIVSRLNTGVSGLLKRANVRVLQGNAKFRDGKTVVVESTNGSVQVHCEYAVIATGSEPVSIPTLPFDDHILSSKELLSLSEVPESLAIVGGGYIGLELGTCFAKFGTKVSIIESETRLLPQYDDELSRPVLKRLEKLGANILTQTTALSYDKTKAELKILDSDGNEESVHASKVLVTVGRRPRLSGWGLEELSLTESNGYLEIDDQCRTSMRGVFAIGDVTGEPMLAHRAMAQGDMVAKIVAGQKQSWDKQCIPSVCFTDPEIVTAGLSPDQAGAVGAEYRVSKFPLGANGRAMTLQREDGFIRVVTQKNTNVILGIQAVGVGVSELSAAFSIAIEMGARAEDIAATIHAHPTLSEGLQEACMTAIGHGLHF
ncbi:MAG: dihydrolipoyl dehydrogenase [Pseudomonadota bacterium]